MPSADAERDGGGHEAAPGRIRPRGQEGGNPRQQRSTLPPSPHRPEGPPIRPEARYSGTPRRCGTRGWACGSSSRARKGTGPRRATTPRSKRARRRTGQAPSARRVFRIDYTREGIPNFAEVGRSESRRHELCLAILVAETVLVCTLTRGSTHRFTPVAKGLITTVRPFDDDPGADPADPLTHL
jgi:hypothetical protein